MFIFLSVKISDFGTKLKIRNILGTGLEHFIQKVLKYWNNGTKRYN